MKIEELLLGQEYRCDSSVLEMEIENITSDVKRISASTLFVFVRSKKFDISNLTEFVVSKKPKAVLCDYELNIESREIPIIRCENTRKALAFAYSAYYRIDYSKIKFCAVTGTNGKTTTATLLEKILLKAKKRVGFIGTGRIAANGKSMTPENYSMTTPDPELLYSAVKTLEDVGCEFVVMEVSSHALYFDKVAPIPFEISVFTNLSPEHLDFHENMDEYFACKMKLFTTAKLGIFNMDDSYSRTAYDISKYNKLSIGTDHDSDIKALDIKLNGIFGSQYLYSTNERNFKVKLNIGGIFNIYNSIMAIGAALALGIDESTAVTALKDVDMIEGRLETINDSVTVIIDYAHTEEAFKNVLKAIYSTKNKGQKLITVFGCGGERDRMKRPKMAAAAELFSDSVIVTQDNSRGESEMSIIKDILSGFTSTEKRKVIISRKAAIENAILSADDGDIIAVIGKGHERYNITKNGYSHFDEREIIKSALEKRRKLHENQAKDTPVTP